MSDSDSLDNSRPKQKEKTKEKVKSYIEELSALSESDDEKKDFLMNTLGIIGKKEPDEVKTSKAFSDELD